MTPTPPRWWKQRTSGKKICSSEPNFAQKIVIEHNTIKSKVSTWNIYFYIQKRLSGNYSALLNIRRDSCAVFIYLGYERVLYLNESCHFCGDCSFKVRRDWVTVCTLRPSHSQLLFGKRSHLQIFQDFLLPRFGCLHHLTFTKTKTTVEVGRGLDRRWDCVYKIEKSI